MSFSQIKIPRASHLAACIALAFSTATLPAQLTQLRIDPPQTDPAIESVHGPHIALYNAQATSAHRLFVFFVGTGNKAESSLPIDSAFANWGYHAIGLDYEDNIVAVSCAHSADSACFDHYRDAIVTGAQVSDKVTVNPANSILNRLQKLLAYLVKTDPVGGWDEYFANGQPVWSRIVVAGHSQGSGHAAYIGKMFKVDRVLMFSGPQDYLDDLDKPAPWQSLPGATPSSQFFAFLNWNDPFNVHHQIANCSVLMDLANPDPLTVDAGVPIHSNAQIFVNNVEAKRAHGSTIQPEFQNVWKTMAAVPDDQPGLNPSSPPPPQPTPQH